MLLTRCTALVATAALASFAQTAPKAFDVASVKVDNVGAGEGGGRGREAINASPGSLSMKNVKLKTAVAWAYHVFPFQVAGQSLNEDVRFDIEAKTPGPTSEADCRVMLQGLLAERFKLTVHSESKEMNAYVVTVGKNGIRFKESGAPGEMELKPNGRAGVKMSHVTTANIMDLLSKAPLPYPVIDHTGLKGSYDIEMDMTPYLSTMSSTPASGPEDMINIMIQGIQDQLGLKVDVRKTPVDMVMVDHAEKLPIDN